MAVLIFGLVVFLAAHSVRIVADDWRARQIARIGEHRWKGAYSLVSLAGLGLIIWGYGLGRADPLVLWHPPPGMRHVTALASVVAFILIAAAYIRGTRIKSALGHPMVAGVTLWALGHLVASGRLSGLVLFGAFATWGIVDFAASRRRDRLAGVAYPAGSLSRDAIAVVVGIAVAILFALYLHGPLIGMRPFG